MDVTIRVDDSGAARSLHRWLDNELSFGSGRVELSGKVVHLDLSATASLRGVAQAVHRWQNARSGHPSVYVGGAEVTAGEPDAVHRLEHLFSTSEQPAPSHWEDPVEREGPEGAPDHAAGPVFPTDV